MHNSQPNADVVEHVPVRHSGREITQGGFNTKCANGPNRDFAVLISNLPTGDLTVLDADYTLRVSNTVRPQG